MKRFLLFYGSDYYPKGGWWDFHGSFESIELASDKFAEDVVNKEMYRSSTWMHIIDNETGLAVMVAGSSCYGNPDELAK